MIYDVKKLHEQLQPGDVFVVHGRHLLSRIIRIVLDSHWNHATLYLGKGEFIEADHTGVHIKSINTYATKETEIYRHTRATKKQRDELVAYARTKVGKRYDHFQIIQLFFYLIFGIRGNARSIGSKNQYICSEVVAEAYAAVGLRCYKHYSPTQISPADFTHSDQFKLCIQKRAKGILILS